MGFFSYHTNDTKEPIWNKYSGKGTKTVFLIDNKGNQWQEDNYEGYGEFGGMRFIDLFIEMNKDNDVVDFLNSIELYYHADDKNHKLYNPNIIYPNLVINPNSKWKNEKPLDHYGQGFWDWEEKENIIEKLGGQNNE